MSCFSQNCFRQRMVINLGPNFQAVQFLLNTLIDFSYFQDVTEHIKYFLIYYYQEMAKTFKMCSKTLEKCIGITYGKIKHIFLPHVSVFIFNLSAFKTVLIVQRRNNLHWILLSKCHITHTILLMRKQNVSVLLVTLYYHKREQKCTRWSNVKHTIDTSV